MMPGSFSSTARTLPRQDATAPLVAEWMSPSVPTTRPDAPLLEALLVMLSDRARSLPVLDEDRRPVGLLTHVQLMQSLASLELRGIERARVSDVMVDDFLTVSEFLPVATVARQMRDERSECVIVVNRAGAFAGTLEEKDFLRAAIERRGL